jgi:hypothetical protein
MYKLLLLFIVLILYETIIMLKRKINRRNLFENAKKRAIETNKKLLVIGDPYNGVASISTGSDYNCGDLCIDLTGCPKCTNSIKTKLEDIISEINLNEYVIYISCVLEYVDELPKILSHLNKIDCKDIYVVTVEWYALNAFFYPYYLTHENPPKNIIYFKNNKINYFKNPFSF